MLLQRKRCSTLFFFSSRRRHTRLQGDWSSDVFSSEIIIRHTRLQGDWSSDVCSSDLIHSSNKARVDSPAWHLVEALATLVSPDGNDPAIEGFADKARPLSAAEEAMIAEAARRLDEGAAKKLLGVDHWVHDVSWREALELLISRPTVNIEGL